MPTMRYRVRTASNITSRKMLERGCASSLAHRWCVALRCCCGWPRLLLWSASSTADSALSAAGSRCTLSVAACRMQHWPLRKHYTHAPFWKINIMSSLRGTLHGIAQNERCAKDSAAAFNAIRGRSSAYACGLGATSSLHTAAVIRARHAKQDQHHRVDDIVLICRVLHSTPRRISMKPQLANTSRMP